MLLVPNSYDHVTLLDPGDRVFMTPKRPDDVRVRRIRAKAGTAAA